MALTKISTAGVKDDIVTTAKIADDAITSALIADDGVVQAAVADEAIDEARLQISNAGSNGQFLSKQSGNTGGLTWATPPDNNTVYTHPNHSGEVTSTADGAQVIANDVVDEANLKVSNSPTNGYFLSAQSGNTGGLTWAEVSAAPTIEAVADGAIADHDSVIITTAGKAKKIVGQDDAVSSEVIFESYTGSSNRIKYQDIAYDSSLDRVLIVYSDTGNSDYGTAIVGTIDRAVPSISFGTPVVYHSGTTTHSKVVAIGSGKFFVFYNNGTTAGVGIVGTVSGTSVSFGTAANAPLVLGPNCACYDTNASAVFIGGADSGGDSSSKGFAATVSGTTITWGSSLAINGGTVAETTCTFDPDANKICYMWNHPTSQEAYSIVLNISGTTLTRFPDDTSSIAFETGEDVDHISATYDTNQNKIVVAYQLDDSSDRGRLKTGQISGTTLTWNSSTDYYYKESDYNSIAFDSGTGRLGIMFKAPNAGHVAQFRSVTLKADGSWTHHDGQDTDPLPATTKMHSGYNASDGLNAPLIAAGSGTFVSAIASEGDDDGGKSAVKTIAETNLTAGNFAGFSDGAYSDGQTATIKVVGNTTTKSSLTAGSYYYMRSGGNLSTTAGSPSVNGGLALSSTKLLIK